jgi:hypothetical protein
LPLTMTITRISFLLVFLHVPGSGSSLSLPIHRMGCADFDIPAPAALIQA